MDSQLNKVQEKYNRRIDRLFQYINQPSLFIRYCWDEEELFYIAAHYSEIKATLKKSNAMNEIVIISHDPYSTADVSNIDYIFFIEKADEDDFNDQPIKSNTSLYEILNNTKYEKKASNLLFKKQKQEQKANERKKLKSKIKRKLDKMVPKKEYIHEKQC